MSSIDENYYEKVFQSIKSVRVTDGQGKSMGFSEGIEEATRLIRFRSDQTFINIFKNICCIVSTDGT